MPEKKLEIRCACGEEIGKGIFRCKFSGECGKKIFFHKTDVYCEHAYKIYKKN